MSQSKSQSKSSQSAERADEKSRSESARPEHAPDYSGEPFVIEEYSTRVRFENDGTGERDLQVRAHIQNDTGVQRLSELVFTFNAASEKANLRFLRVTHPDGSTFSGDADSVTDATPDALRDAPAYANYKEKHVKIPGLHPGDTVEYKITTLTVTPVAKGQFWYDHNFVDAAVVLDERFEIDLPANRKVTLRSADAHFTQKETAGRKIYTWQRANSTVRNSGDAGASASSAASAKSGAGGPDTPAVELTSFATWREVAKWYAELQPDRAAAIAAVRDQATQLANAHSQQSEKIRAIYDFVSEKVRYVDLPLGLDGYQPHAPGEVLARQYGDSKDKCALLVAMLEAIGVHANAALIPLGRKTDPLAPSPSQFDHVVATIPQGTLDPTWLDASSGTAPFRYLIPNLRGKKALVVFAAGSANLAQTPDNPPFLSTQEVTVDGRVSELGKLTAEIHYRLRGDNEFAFRSALRRAPESQWKQIGQTVALLDGFHGEVTRIDARNVDAPEEPLELTLDYAQKNFLDWTAPSSKMAVPLPALGLPDLPSVKSAPILLGSPLVVTVRMKLALPKGDSAHLPAGVAVTRDYAEYQSAYVIADGAVDAKRTIRFKLRELPAARMDDYQAFARAVLADGSQRITVENPNAGAAKIPDAATAAELVESGTAALNAGDARRALELLTRASQLEPERKDVWNALGLARLRLDEHDAAVAAFKKQLEVDPKDETVNDYLGVTLMQQQKLDEAAAAFRKQVEIKPLDKFAHASLGLILVQQKNFNDAIPELEKAAVLAPDNSQLQLTLAEAYVNAGKPSDAIAAFEKAAKISPTPDTLNTIAQQMVQDNVDLERAEQYANLSVNAENSALKSADLDHLTDDNLAQVQNLGSYWNTLGWVRVQEGDFDGAETYLRAAWKLTQNGAAGDHLAQLYEKRGRKDLAIQTYLLALAAPHSPKDTQSHLAALAGDAIVTDDRLKQARAQLASERIYTVKNSGTEGVEADFWLLIVPNRASSRADEVKFIHGNDSLREATARLREIDFGSMFPDNAASKLVRRGTLSCTNKSVDCTLILNRPEEVTSADSQ